MAKKSKTGGGTPALALLKNSDITHQLHEYDHAAAELSGLGYGMAAAAALGVAAERVFKTLIALVDGQLRVGVIPVDAQLDLKAFAAAHGGKSAVMADPTQAERSSGYVTGGISPLGQRKILPTVIDSSAERLPNILVSAGRRGLDVELVPQDLATLLNAHFAPITRR